MTKKGIIVLIAVTIITLSGGYILWNEFGNETISSDTDDVRYEKQTEPFNLTFMIGEENLTFTDGIYERSDGRRAEITEYSIINDMNGDGRPERMVIIKDGRTDEGVPQKYYISMVIDQPQGLITTESHYLGDDISLKEISYSGTTNEITIKTTERTDREPFFEEVSRIFKLDGEEFIEIKI
jgi:hypothetical protein